MARQAARSTGGREKKTCCWRWRPTRPPIRTSGKAREFSRRAADSAVLAAGKKLRRATTLCLLCGRLCSANAAEARRQATVAKRSSTGEIWIMGGANPCLCRRRNPSASMADDLARVPRRHKSSVHYLPTLRANLRSFVQTRSRRLIFLGSLLPTNLVCRRLALHWPNLYPVYVRGEAYLAAHRATKRQQSFKTSSTIAGSCPTHPSVRWRISNWAAHTPSRRHRQEPRRVPEFSDIVERRRS